MQSYLLELVTSLRCVKYVAFTVYCPFQVSWPRDLFHEKNPVTTVRKP